MASLPQTFDVSNKTVSVTGCSRGIGGEVRTRCLIANKQCDPPYMLARTAAALHPHTPNEPRGTRLSIARPVRHIQVSTL